MLLANLLAALIFAWTIAAADVFPSRTREVFLEIGRADLHSNLSLSLIKAIFAGWIIAVIIWLLPAAASGQIASS